jgi:hypothetical protein
MLVRLDGRRGHLVRNLSGDSLFFALDTGEQLVERVGKFLDALVLELLSDLLV